MPQLTHNVVDTDNFGGDYPHDYALAWIDAKGRCHRAEFTEQEARAIAAVLQASRGGEHARRYYTMREKGKPLGEEFEP